MKAWRDAAEEAGVLRHFEAGLAEFNVPYKPQVGLSEDWDVAFRAYQAGVALGWARVRFDGEGETPTSRLDVTLAALKRVERRGYNPEDYPTCAGCGAVAVHDRHFWRWRWIVLKRAIPHREGCIVAQALYGEGRCA